MGKEHILPDYRAKKKNSEEWVYGVPLVDDSGCRMSVKKLFHLPTGDFYAYIPCVDFDLDTLERFTGEYTENLEKIYK